MSPKASQDVSPSSVDFATLVDLVRWRARELPDRPIYTFLQDGETDRVVMTYQDLDRKARAIGARLQALGAGGERALLLSEPSLEYVAAFFGCLYAGMAAVPAYPPDPTRMERTLPRLLAIASDARPRVVLTTAFILPIAEELIEEFPDFQGVHGLSTDDLPVEGAQGWQDPRATADTLAFLQYTSGSTASPKGVMLTHGNLMCNLALIQEAFQADSTSQGVFWLPPYHDMGLIGGILEPIYCDATVILMSPIDFLRRPMRWLEAMSRAGANISGGPNFAFDLCVRKSTPEQRAALDLSNWNLAFNGAEPVRPETMERFAEAFAVSGFRKEAFYPCYGLAEGTLIVSGGDKTQAPVVTAVGSSDLARGQVRSVSAGDEAQLLVGCGHTLGQQEIVIVDPITREHSAPNRIGEVWVSGCSVAQGYWGRAEDTQETFRARTVSGEGPFLRTGDLGFLQGGELFIAGRVKDLIIIRGRNHYPQDIELTVERSHPALRPGCSAAFSVDVAGDERLVVVQELDTRKDGDPSEVIDTIRQAIARDHELQAYAVVLLEPRSIPKTSSGKIQRHLCREGFLNQELEVIQSSVLEAEVADEEVPEHEVLHDILLAMPPAARQPFVEAYLRTQIARALKISPTRLSLEQPITTLGLDSLMAVELKYAIEYNLGIELPIEVLLEEIGISHLAERALAELPE